LEIMDIVCNTSSNPFKHYTFASKHVKEQCCASEEGQICRAGPPDHYWCQGSAGHDTAWIFEIRPREQNCAPDGKAPLPTKAKQSTRRPTYPNHNFFVERVT